MSALSLVFVSALAATSVPFDRLVEGRSPTARCMVLPVRLQSARSVRTDLNADGRPDRLVEVPGSCAVTACTWRAYGGCPEGGYRLLIEMIALSMEPATTATNGWQDLRATVPAPSREPQAWLLQYNNGAYVPSEPQ